LKKGRPIIVHGDGTSLWVVTHAEDFGRGFLGLVGNWKAIGHAFHITSDEVLTWDQISRATAEAAGVSSPKLVHIACDFIVSCVPGYAGPLLGDKANCAVFDNSKIKRFVPDYVATVRYRQGIEASINWYDVDPSRRQVDEAANAEWDRIIAVYEKGRDAAQREFAKP